MADINGTFVLALLGALAWFPQLISWVNSFFTKPKLRFVPDGTTEIGYTFFGPIINHFFAISSDRKDALIEKMTFEITHEKGEKHNFCWKFLDERGPELTSVSGECAQWGKNQSAIALKVTTTGLTEKKIGFQDTDFQDKLRGIVNVQSEKVFYLEKTQPQTYKDEAVKAKEFLDVLDFVKTGFYWKEGKYTVALFVYETTLKEPHSEYFEFELTKRDIEVLEKNIKEIHEYFKNLILYKGVDPKTKTWPLQYFNWVNPRFIRRRR